MLWSSCRGRFSRFLPPWNDRGLQDLLGELVFFFLIAVDWSCKTYHWVGQRDFKVQLDDQAVVKKQPMITTGKKVREPRAPIQKDNIQQKINQTLSYSTIFFLRGKEGYSSFGEVDQRQCYSLARSAFPSFYRRSERSKILSFSQKKGHLFEQCLTFRKADEKHKPGNFSSKKELPTPILFHLQSIMVEEKHMQWWFLTVKWRFE